MLRFLSVRHLAVIDAVEIDLDHGFTVLTGETGAGKSILVEALDLLVGGRASVDLVRTGESQAVVQAIFERSDGTERIVRREITAAGRSRAFIDDALATSLALRDLGRTFIDLHGQHEHQQLLDPAEHIAILDAHARLDHFAGTVAARFETWSAARAALDRTRLDDAGKRAELDMARFQLQEIDKVAPVAGEDAALSAERSVLANADRLSRLSAEAYDLLHEREEAVLAGLAGVWKRLEELAALDRRFAAHLDGRETVTSLLGDLAFALRDYAADLDASPERLQAVEDRLAALERLKRRHGSLDAVLEKRRQLVADIDALDAGEDRVRQLERDEREARDAFVAAAGDLSARRRAAAGPLARALAADLAELAMPGARVDIRIADVPDGAWHRRGVDSVEFFISPNPGEGLRPLARIASGGELSRIMLSLRTIGVPDEPGRTLVFDEVDAGIGGEAADAVGARLQALSARAQVLCVTHLAQIAARADAHFHVSKLVEDQRTSAVVLRLDRAGREQEIARMIAGAQVTGKVLASAQDMLRTRAKGEIEAKGEGRVARPRAKAKGKGRA